jgi:hypothetical protein
MVVEGWEMMGVYIWTADLQGFWSIRRVTRVADTV